MDATSAVAPSPETKSALKMRASPAPRAARSAASASPRAVSRTTSAKRVSCAAQRRAQACAMADVAPKIAMFIR